MIIEKRSAEVIELLLSEANIKFEWRPAIEQGDHDILRAKVTGGNCIFYFCNDGSLKMIYVVKDA